MTTPSYFPEEGFVQHDFGDVAAVRLRTDSNGQSLIDRLGPESEASLVNGVYLTPIALEDDFSEAKDFTTERIFTGEPDKAPYHIHIDPNLGSVVFVFAWWNEKYAESYLDGIRLVDMSYGVDDITDDHLLAATSMNAPTLSDRRDNFLQAAGYSGPEQIGLRLAVGGLFQRAQLVLECYDRLDSDNSPPGNTGIGFHAIHWSIMQQESQQYMNNLTGKNPPREGGSRNHC